jgi:hypothetical protein
MHLLRVAVQPQLHTQANMARQYDTK